jgi:lysophospholipase L1-like esterase
MVLTDRPLTPIESAYLPAIKALCEKNGAALAILMLPMTNSQGPTEVSRQVLALGIPIVAASLESMFGDIPTERIKENYFDHIHFNANGARRSAEAYGPALQALLQRTGG